MLVKGREPGSACLTMRRKTFPKFALPFVSPSLYCSINVLPVASEGASFFIPSRLSKEPLNTIDASPSPASRHRPFCHPTFKVPFPLNHHHPLPLISLDPIEAFYEP